MLHIKPNNDFSVSPGWLEAANLLSGQSVSRMAILILSLAQESGKRSVLIRPSSIYQFNLKRITAYKALNKLEEAGLIQLYRQRRLPPCATILDIQ